MTNPIKSLMKDTAIYGLSSIVGRFLNWLLVPFYTYILPTPRDYGIVTNLYAWTALLLIILTYGMETGFFRYINKDKDPRSVYSTTLWSLGITSSLFVVVCFLFLDPVSNLLGYPQQAYLIGMLVIIIAMDAFMAIPFAYLRYAKRPWRFAFLRFAFIGLNIGLNIFFLLLCPLLMRTAPYLVDWFYHPEHSIAYIFIANFLADIVLLLLILPYCRTGFAFRPKLLRRMLSYSFPILILGIAGNFNKVADKILFPLLFSDRAHADTQLGIYGACFKIAVVMVMFTQAFRYAYEPFIFTKREGNDASDRNAYALAMKYYLIFSLFIFLGVYGFLDLLKYAINAKYFSGLDVVAPVMLGELMFGVYFNLSLWYKVTDKTYWGAVFSGLGCIITVLIIILGVPHFGFMACAWASVVSNGSVMLLSYLIGRYHYAVPYDLATAGKYTLLAAVAFTLMCIGKHQIPYPALSMAFNSLLVIAFLLYASHRGDIPLSRITRSLTSKIKHR